MSQHAADNQRWMRAALTMARYGLGRCAPNPSVGCVIINNHILVGIGRTADGGRPHAETEALAMAGVKAKGATAFVTLEPCAHHGKTPPCADALIKAGIARVVIGVIDPDTHVAGKGMARLKDAGIDVICMDVAEVALFYAPYFHHRKMGRPYVTVKVASTLDGKIALADGQSKWITGARTRQYVHVLRSQHDAVLTSGETMRADNPQLTCRLEGYHGPQPKRIVVGRHPELLPEGNLAQTAHISPVILVGVDVQDTPAGVTSVSVAAGEDGFPVLDDMLTQLGDQGIASLMVEAGGKFLAALMRAGLVDKLIWTRSSGVIGGDGRPSISDLGLDTVAGGHLFSHQSSLSIDQDMIEIYTRAPYLN